jgi:rhodanese-related sulfurtransferase
VFQRLFSRGGAAPVENITATDAIRLHAAPDSIFVDVRGADEIARSGTVPGAVRAPLPGLDNSATPQGSGALPAADSGKPIVLVCASGMRSSVAAQQLATMGYGKVHNLRGGISAWIAAGGPVMR